MRVLVGMSGGVDSSVTAHLLKKEGHEVVGATMRLWDGGLEGTCCSLAEIDDARRVAQQLGIDHHVFNFRKDFEAHVVGPYVEEHGAGRTPNPCIECNRHIKFDRFLERARALGFDAIATGHYARVTEESGSWKLRRAIDKHKDQSYVLYVLQQEQLSRCLFPIGELKKSEVRAIAAQLSLRTADKPDSQDVCFITSSGGREKFLSDRIPLRAAKLIEFSTGQETGRVDALELVTVGQRRGLPGGTNGQRRYVLKVDPSSETVTVGSHGESLTKEIELVSFSWTYHPPKTGKEVTVQTSAHGIPVVGVYEGDRVHLMVPQRRVAPGQSVVLYDDDVVLGGGIAV